MVRALLAIALVTAAPAVAVAEEAPVIVRGTAGLVAVSFRADNRTDGAMACGAAIAHWYSMPVGEAGPDAAVTATLWSDPKTGAVFLLNAKQDRMPVQSLWCGRAGSDVTTGYRILLQRRAGAAEPAVRLACRAGRDKALDCTPSAGP